MQSHDIDTRRRNETTLKWEFEERHCLPKAETSAVRNRWIVLAKSGWAAAMGNSWTKTKDDDNSANDNWVCNSPGSDIQDWIDGRPRVAGELSDCDMAKRLAKETLAKHDERDVERKRRGSEAGAEALRHAHRSHDTKWWCENRPAGSIDEEEQRNRLRTRITKSTTRSWEAENKEAKEIELLQAAAREDGIKGSMETSESVARKKLNQDLTHGEQEPLLRREPDIWKRYKGKQMDVRWMRRWEREKAR
jgi:hypothetical protein